MEEIIDVEYLEKYISPVPVDCLLHDDWVSTVAVCDKWLIIIIAIKKLNFIFIILFSSILYICIYVCVLGEIYNTTNYSIQDFNWLLR